tara:strand:+ start:591 stop:1121 length:531 start_codon:yes stop_codon:yes gene_type:complete
MKFTPLLLLPFLISPASAESIGDRSNRKAYEDAQAVNWLTRTYDPPAGHYRRHDPHRLPWWRASNDQYQPGYSSSSTCTRKEYREEYVPGTANNPGYVKTWHDTIEVPCNTRPTRTTVIRERTPSPDGNECQEGAILGGILGGGAGAALSQGDGRWWAIPLGIVGGSIIGCDIDGG